MAAQPDISAILAALAAQRPASTPSQPPQQHQTQQNIPQGYPAPTPPAGIPGFALPQPTNSGSLDLSAIKPVNTGSVSLQDALAKARGFAAEKGLAYDSGRSSTVSREDPRLAGRSYRRSRSRSRTPPRRDNLRDSYNPYRDERREDPRRGGIGYGRERSRSPPRGRNNFSPPRGYAARDRSPPSSDNSETILIDSSLVGLVIGRQGENLRRIEQDTGTRIQFVTGPEAGGPQRQCKITGNLRARVDAKREINRIIEENGGNPAREAASGRGRGGGAAAKAGHQPALREGENSIQIMVPDRTVGLIIGRGGETIRDLQERSGCHVNIVGENKSVNGLRPVNLIGTPQAAARAKELILEIVDSDTKTLASGGNQVPEGRRPDFDSFGGAGGGNKVNDTIMVPSDAVGMIIGKGGETIKEMQNSTGCKINVSQASGADIEREIGLVGTRQAIDDAKKAIWDKVDSVKEKNGGYGGNRKPGGRDHVNNYSDNYSQQQQPYGQPQGAVQNLPQVQSNAPPQAAAGEDPYAAWGGYQNWVAYYWASVAAQQSQGGDQRPPGAA
ncbi:hypothetical protein K432DRAFT_400025 [Lepidopterella palustris CBS 459.81]|uniref:K Homology domain-containing protein n=1 Tax=Lepidopterella palustris CBS 459.81 TaxID=1314670 RepID=A0A8E2EKJ6_9PEZI|nr:hypothetical protein K432DRAFT_400025 [Lepidopterella palustris CBS 459.81]